MGSLQPRIRTRPDGSANNSAGGRRCRQAFRCAALGVPARTPCSPAPQGCCATRHDAPTWRPGGGHEGRGRGVRHELRRQRRAAVPAPRHGRAGQPLKHGVLGVVALLEGHQRDCLQGHKGACGAAHRSGRWAAGAGRPGGGRGGRARDHGSRACAAQRCCSGLSCSQAAPNHRTLSTPSFSPAMVTMRWLVGDCAASLEVTLQSGRGAAAVGVKRGELPVVPWCTRVAGGSARGGTHPTARTRPQPAWPHASTSWLPCCELTKQAHARNAPHRMTVFVSAA